MGQCNGRMQSITFVEKYGGEYTTFLVSYAVPLSPHWLTTQRVPCR
jgi:hypothetical protein